MCEGGGMGGGKSCPLHARVEEPVDGDVVEDPPRLVAGEGGRPPPQGTLLVRAHAVKAAEGGWEGGVRGGREGVVC